MLNLKRRCTIFLSIWLSFTVMAENLYDKDQLLLAIDNGLATKNIVLVTALGRSVEYYESTKDDKFLLRLLKKFDKILDNKDAFFLVDNLSNIYKKDPSKFKKLLKMALDDEDYKKFMDHMNNILREAREGNG